MIKLTNIGKSYAVGGRDIPVLHGVNLTVNMGDLVAIVGASGSGKSTLMHIMGLLDSPTSGTYFLDGVAVDQYGPDELARVRNREIGFIFQNFALLPQYPVWYNVGLPLHYRTSDLAFIKRRAQAYLEQVGLPDVADRYPHALSGGQQQRVACARALIAEPRLILADEPTGALDSQTSTDFMQFLQTLNKTQQTTIVIITHDHAVAAYAQQVWRMDDGVLNPERG
jgi:putative ABC transport system ATP-binding protein